MLGIISLPFTPEGLDRVDAGRPECWHKGGKQRSSHHKKDST